jgi:hypothetical protein
LVLKQVLKSFPLGLIFCVMVWGCRMPSHSKKLDKQKIPFQILATSTDSAYGYHPEHPVAVGHQKQKRLEGYTSQAPAYLQKLKGPDGLAVQFKFVGVCCDFFCADALAGIGFIEVYEIRHHEWKDPRFIYLNPCVMDTLKAPVGMKH